MTIPRYIRRPQVVPIIIISTYAVSSQWPIEISLFIQYNRMKHWPLSVRRPRVVHSRNLMNGIEYCKVLW